MTDLFRDVSVDEITPGLFIGNMTCVESERTLKQLKITAVVSVVSTYRRPFPQPSTQSGLKRRHRHPLEKLYDVKDRIVVFVDDTRSDNIFRHFEGACKFIDSQLHRRGAGCVLVHCTLGISRSVSIVAAYIMWKWGFCTSRALQYIKKKRSKASPNEGFIDQLLVWEKLRCNPWLSRRFHVRPQAYYDMTNRLENYKRIREVRKTMEMASEEKATRGIHRTKDSARAHSVQDHTFRYCTRAKH
jgi:hypothetical protein